MTILELTRTRELSGWTAYSPFVMQANLGRAILADYWKAWTGEDDILARVFVLQFLEVQGLVNYSSVLSLATCQAQEGSFFWDNGSQVLYVHHIHETDTIPSLYLYGQAQGFTDGDVVYIDNIYYAPLLRSAPDVSSDVDLTQYNALQFNAGSIEIDNTAGDMDDVIREPIYGNQVSLYYLSPGPSNMARSDLYPTASYYVEDYDFSVGKLTINAIDRRKEQNAQVIASYTPDGQPVPRIYGTVQVAKALPLNPDDTGDINFRVAESLVSLGTVEVDIDGVWTARTPTATDLASGSFTLSGADGRVGGDTSAGPLDCRVVGPSGVAVTYASDIIKALNLDVLGTVYDSSNYDTTEWEAEQTGLLTAGVVFDEEILLFDAIAMVQNGASVGFRYEIGPTGKRTIRVDDWDRPVSFTVGQESIANGLDMPVESDSSVLAASVVVKWGKDWNSERYSILTDTSRLASVLRNYRQKPTLTTETILLSSGAAQVKAEWLLDRLSVVPRYVTLDLIGMEYIGLRIFDVGEVDLAVNDERAYFGRWKVSVVGVAPDFSTGINRVRFALIEEL